MKKFIFRLQRVLDLREQQEERCKTDLQVAAQNLAQAKALWQELQKQREQQSEFADDRYWHLMGTFLAGLLERLSRAEEQIQRAELELQQAKQHYIEAYREAEKLRKLRAKQQQAYSDKLQREDDKFLDEIATLAYGRKSKI
jgi:flagellar export protein FliJ